MYAFVASVSQERPDDWDHDVEIWCDRYVWQAPPPLSVLASLIRPYRSICPAMLVYTTFSAELD